MAQNMGLYALNPNKEIWRKDFDDSLDFVPSLNKSIVSVRVDFNEIIPSDKYSAGLERLKIIVA